MKEIKNDGTEETKNNGRTDYSAYFYFLEGRKRSEEKIGENERKSRNM